MAEARVIKSEIRLNRLTGVVNTTPTRIAPQDPNRLVALVANTSANPIWVGFDERVAPGRGILLGAYGGSLVLTRAEDHEAAYAELWAVAEVSASTISVVEVIALEPKEGGSAGR
ncbi:MAG: hypothetical protein QW734_09075 [Candidatus Bathyarchaeia archaeon]